MNLKAININGFLLLDHLLLDCRLFTTASQDKESTVSEIANLVKKWPTSLDATHDLWAEYRNWRIFSTRETIVKLSDPGSWLLKTPSQTWFDLLSLYEKRSKVDKYELMFALGTLAYRSDIDPELVRALLVMATNANHLRLQQAIRLRPVGDFDLAPGHILEPNDVQSIAEACYKSYEWSPQSQLARSAGESKNALKSRRLRAYNSKRTELCTSITGLVFKMWPSSTIVWPADMSTYSLIDVSSFKKRVESLFSSRFRNRRLFEHANELQAVFDALRRPYQELRLRILRTPKAIIPSAKYVHITLSSLMSCRDPPTPKTYSCDALSNAVRKRSPLSIRAILTKLCDEPENEFLSRYAQDLAKCVDAFEDQLFNNCVGNDSQCNSSSISPEFVEKSLQPRSISEKVLCDTGHWPSLGPESLLRQLSFELRGQLCKDWLASLVSYAEALAFVQQKRRLSILLRLGLHVEYAKEAENRGGRGCDGMAYPDWLLIQIDANIRIRPVQISIAREMMSPENQTNAVMQLNMGEGKSSVSPASFLLIVHYS
jgi:hypothetical protein